MEMEMKSQLAEEHCPILSTSNANHPQPAVILVIDPTVDNCKLLEITKLLLQHNISSFVESTEERIFLCLYLTPKQSEELAQKYSYNVRFMIKRGRNHGKCHSPWTKFISLLQYGSVAYKSFTEVNYSVAYCKDMKEKLKPEDVEVLHSVRVQSELIYLILKSEQILDEEDYKIKTDFVPHSSDLNILREKISWMPLSFPLEEFRDYFGEEMAFGYAWSNFWVIFGLFPISIAAFLCLIYGLCTYNKPKSELGTYFISSMFTTKFWDDFHDIMLNAGSDIYVGFLLIWINVFQYQWSKAGCILSLQWGVSNYSLQEEECKKYDTRRKKLRKYIRVPQIIISITGFLLAATYTFLLFIMTEVILRVQLNKLSQSILKEDHQTWFISFLCSMFYTVLNGVAGSYFIPWISDRLTSFENHKFQSYYNNSVILKFAGYYLMSSYLYLIYLIFGLNVWLSEKFNLSKDALNLCGESMCFITVVQQIITQVVLLRLKPVGKALIQWAISKLKSKAKSYENKQEVRYILENFNTIELIGSDGYMLWVTDRILMYGFITLFSYHIPIVSIVALFLEVMVTDFELRWLTCSQRPRPRRCNNINQWLGIIYLLNIMSTLINSYAIALRITGYEKSARDMSDIPPATPEFTNVSVIVLPIFILVSSLIHIQGIASGDKVQSHLHAQYCESLKLITGAKSAQELDQDIGTSNRPEDDISQV